MITEITNGVSVSVETHFLEEHSNAALFHYVFSYRIIIENHGDHAVQLMRRHWIIYDSDGSEREVEGEGVVGLQPLLEPGQRHEYVSGCNFHMDMGKMKGSYQMMRLYDGSLFSVNIPEFCMIAPFRLN